MDTVLLRLITASILVAYFLHGILYRDDHLSMLVVSFVANSVKLYSISTIWYIRALAPNVLSQNVWNVYRNKEMFLLESMKSVSNAIFGR